MKTNLIYLCNMAKDPAFLFYSNDFDMGTKFFTDEEVGKYVRLLIAQHQHGHLNKKQMLLIMGTENPDIVSKFKVDEKGLFYNERLDNEVNKRKRKVVTYTDEPTQETVELSDTLKDKDINIIENRIKRFNKTVIDKFGSKFSSEMLKEFCDYWCEHNEGGVKLRFEMEKVFDISRRLGTWARYTKVPSKGQSPAPVDKQRVIEEALILCRAHGGKGSDIPESRCLEIFKAMPFNLKIKVKTPAAELSQGSPMQLTHERKLAVHEYLNHLLNG